MSILKAEVTTVKVGYREFEGLMFEDRSYCPDSLPNESGMYFVIDRKTRELLYVGITKNFVNRWKNHHVLPALIGFDYEIRICILPDNRLLGQKEIEIIRKCQPKLNIAHKHLEKKQKKVSRLEMLEFETYAKQAATSLVKDYLNDLQEFIKDLERCHFYYSNSVEKLMNYVEFTKLLKDETIVDMIGQYFETKVELSQSKITYGNANEYLAIFRLNQGNFKNIEELKFAINRKIDEEYTQKRLRALNTTANLLKELFLKNNYCEFNYLKTLIRKVSKQKTKKLQIDIAQNMDFIEWFAQVKIEKYGMEPLEAVKAAIDFKTAPSLF